MPDYPITLGKPDIGGAIPFPTSPRDPEMYYPCVHIDLPEGVELPDEGTITFQYKMNRVTEDVKNEKTCADMDLTALVDVKADKSSKKEEYGGDALDKLKAELESE